MFHGARALNDQSLLNIMYSPFVKKRRKNKSHIDVDESIPNIQIGNISQEKLVREYEIPRRTLARKCKNKIDIVAENSPGPILVLVKAAEKDLVQWSLSMKKQRLLVGHETIISKAYEIHRYMFESIRSVGLVGQGWCD